MGLFLKMLLLDVINLLIFLFLCNKLVPKLAPLIPVWMFLWRRLLTQTLESRLVLRGLCLSHSMTAAQACCVYHKFFRSFFFDFPSNLAVSEFSGEYSIVSSFVWLSFQCCLSIGSNLLSLRATSLLSISNLDTKSS